MNHWKIWLRMKQRDFGAWLVRKGMKVRGFKENFDNQDFAICWSEMFVSLCRNCGSPTQTTDHICWRCIDAYEDTK